MEIFLIFIVILLVVLFQTGIANKLSGIDQKLKRLEDHMKAQDKRGAESTQASPVKAGPKLAEKDPEFYIPSPFAKKEDKAPEPVKEAVKEPEQEAIKKPEIEPVKEEEQPLPAYVVEELIEESELEMEEKEDAPQEPVPDPVKVESKPQPVFVAKPRPRPQIVQEETWYEKFRKKNPDLEKFIGENILSKIAIAILVLGIGFFVKYAIDKNWINEAARVGIGMLAGGIVLTFAHRLRKNFSAFSSVLVGGGIAIFYFTIGIGFHTYHLFSQTVSFSLMLLITTFSVFISIAYNRIELAVLSLIGGFSTPFMVSTGTGNYQILFTYILILDVGMLVLSYFKRWNLIKILSYVFSILLYVVWLESKVIGDPRGPYMGALFFGSLFYVLFMVMNLINNLKEKRKFDPFEISILLSNTFIYFGTGMQILSYHAEQYQGLFSISLAIFNMLGAWFLYKRFDADKNLLYTLIGLTLTFLSVSGPVQLDGNNITIFWATESLLLLWLAQRSGLVIYRFTGGVLVLFTVLSLVWDWVNIYRDVPSAQIQDIIINKGFLTSLYVVATIWLQAVLLKKEGHQKFEFRELSYDTSNFRMTLRIATLLILYLVGFIELIYQLNHRLSLQNAPVILEGAYHMLFLAVLNFKYGNTIREQFKKVLLFGNIFTILIFSFGLAIMPLYDFTENLKRSDPQRIGLIFHYINMLLFVYICSASLKLGKTRVTIDGNTKNLLYSAAMALIVYFLSVELLLHVSLIRLNSMASNLPEDAFSKTIEYHGLRRQVFKVGFPILWGLISFVFLNLGLRRKVREFRIGALLLIAIILIKLFTYDISNASEAGKIIAFIILGVVLLIISFLYQKIKALVANDDKLQEEQITNEDENK